MLASPLQPELSLGAALPEELSLAEVAVPATNSSPTNVFERLYNQAFDKQPQHGKADEEHQHSKREVQLSLPMTAGLHNSDLNEIACACAASDIVADDNVKAAHGPSYLAWLCGLDSLQDAQAYH